MTERIKTSLVLHGAIAMFGAALLLQGGCSGDRGEATQADAPPWSAWATPQLASLEDLSIESLRKRDYGSVITPLAQLESAGHRPGTAFLASYVSDGLRIYTRIDIPEGEPPEGGFPVLIFVHGWYGLEKAPAFDFFQQADSQYARLVRSYVKEGFVVLSPALRGHGTVNGIPAEGIEFLRKWDNGSYLGPMFYTIDVLNLLEGIPSLENAYLSNRGDGQGTRLDKKRISITGHSQGGDAVLAALAISGESSSISNPLFAGSIASGCFGPRMEQAGIYGPMANTLEAFMAGDGRWTGTATGLDGSVNPEFVFGYPPDWIGTVDPQSPQWTWQAQTWSVPTVAQSLEAKFTEMYNAINMGVKDMSGTAFRLDKNTNGRTVARHDARVASAMDRIGGFHYPQYLPEPLQLHHSDQDYYSPPRWNAALASSINASGGNAVDFIYPGNTHSLGVSKHEWFSPGEVVAGFATMITRDSHLFKTGSTAPATPPESDLVSPESLALYARTLHNRFESEFEREPLADLGRRVVSFRADGLKQYALVVEPAGEMPANGWPVLLMNHGYHPEPLKNGKREDGTTDRPGDYYRGLPQAYAQAGFLVVWPDYRGHNVSEGYTFTQGERPTSWYARDLVAAVRALPSLPRADLQNVFLWGHSMGGNVVLRALPALGDEIRGASLWSSGAESGVTRYLTTAPSPAIIIQHSEGDTSVPSAWSIETCRELKELGLDVNCFFYENSDHLFTGDSLDQAILRDMQAFLHKMQN